MHAKPLLLICLLAAVAFAPAAQATFVTVGYAVAQHSDDGQSWSQMSAPDTHALNAVAYGNGMWVAVGGTCTGLCGNGAIWASPDGRDWTPQKLPATTNYPINGVVFGNGLFVAVGSYSPTTMLQVAFTSPDGINWTERQTGGPYSMYFRSITYGNGLYVAVGSTGAVMTSPDTIVWSQQASGVTGYLYGVHYANGQFVAVGAGGVVRTSTDGVAWVPQTSGTTAILYSVTYGNGTWMTVGSSQVILTSPDAVTWTVRTPGTMYWPTFYGVAYGNGRFVTVSNSIYPNSTTYSATLLTSTDNGATWQARPATGYYYYGPRAVHYGAGQWVAVGYYSIIRSSNGLDWDTRSPMTSYYRYDVASNGTHWVAPGVYYGAVQSSDNGKDWTSRYTGFGTWNYPVYGAGYGAGRWTVVGSPGLVLTSQDTAKWTARSSGTSAALYGVGYGPGAWVAVGAGGTIITSPDGNAWKPSFSPTSQTLWRVAYGDGQWISVGYNGVIVTSADAVLWKLRNSMGSNLYDVAYEANPTEPTAQKWVAVGDSGTIRTSMDGTAWTTAASPTGNALYGVAYQDGQWVAAGTNVILSSVDGVIWDTVSTMTATTYALASDRVPPLECRSQQYASAGSPTWFAGYGGVWPYTWTAPDSNNPDPSSGSRITRNYADEGVFTVTLQDSSDPPQEVTCMVEVSPAPPAPVSCDPQLQTTWTDTAVPLSAAGGFPPYIWSMPDANDQGPLEGAQASVTYAVAGIYRVTLTDKFDQTASCWIIVSGTSGGGGSSPPPTTGTEAPPPPPALDPIGEGGASAATPETTPVYGPLAAAAAHVAPPIADAGQDLTVKPGETVRLDGSGSIGEALRYSWLQLSGPPVVLGGSATATPAFRAPDLPGVLTFELTVEDAGGRKATSVVTAVVVVAESPVSLVGADSQGESAARSPQLAAASAQSNGFWIPLGLLGAGAAAFLLVFLRIGRKAPKA